MTTTHIQRVVVVEQLHIALITVIIPSRRLIVLRHDKAVQRAATEAAKLLELLRQALLVVAGENVVDREWSRRHFHCRFSKIHFFASPTVTFHNVTQVIQTA